MAKGSGNTRNNTSKGFEWSHSDSFEDVLHDAQQIFKKEATAGLGNFMQRKPKKVSDAKYEELLKSGDYIEVVHGSNQKGINDLVNGKYYINNDLHVSGFGYYFSTQKMTGEGYSSQKGEQMLTALIKKSDILQQSNITKEEREQGYKRYLGSSPILKNGKPLDSMYKKNFYDTSTIAAHKGYKAVTSKSFNIVVIDRSALIVRKKG